jgi:uncharacterized RDD family membrane protein YckC
MVVERIPDRTRGSALQGRPAGLVSRFGAAAVDLVVVVVVLWGVYAAVAGFAFLIDPRSFHWPKNLGWSIPVIGAGIAWPYLSIAWSASGRTIGDVMFGLRVVSYRGTRMRFVGAVARAAFCLVFPIGLLWIPFSRQRRSVQDSVIRTRVIYDWTAAQPPLSPRIGSPTAGA